MTHSAIVGAILGTAVGDALGLPYEGLSSRRGASLFGEPSRHQFFLGGGMVSDDTEHTCLVAQALIASGGQSEAFAHQLGRRLRWWALGIPAGIGYATLRAVLKLWCGIPTEKSGVFSAGNGPAMRSAVLGAAIDDVARLQSLVAVSTRITHTDPKAECGAFAVALAACLARRYPLVDGSLYIEMLRQCLPSTSAGDFLRVMERAVHSAGRGESTRAFAESEGWGNGVSGYVYHSVPVAIHAWLRHQRDLPAGLMDVIQCGGDTDTTAAIAGGILGAGVGKEGIPPEWLTGLWEWPRTVAWMERLGQQLARTLADGVPGKAPRLPAAGLLARNTGFMLIVLGHAARRCLPPY
jgi:ADP-ribosylglycohydrolase